MGNHIGKLVNENQEAATGLNDALADLDKRAADLQSQLGEIRGPLKAVSFELSEIAPLLPLPTPHDSALASIAWVLERPPFLTPPVLTAIAVVCVVGARAWRGVDRGGFRGAESRELS